MGHLTVKFSYINWEIAKVFRKVQMPDGDDRGMELTDALLFCASFLLAFQKRGMDNQA